MIGLEYMEFYQILELSGTENKIFFVEFLKNAMDYNLVCYGH